MCDDCGPKVSQEDSTRLAIFNAIDDLLRNEKIARQQAERELANQKALGVAVADSLHAELEHVRKLTRELDQLTQESAKSLEEERCKVRRLEELRRIASKDTDCLRDRVVRAESERNDARAEVARLQARQQDLLATVAKLSQTTPFPEELAGWEGQRAKMIAEVGTLRAEVARLNGVVEGMEQGAAVLRRDLERVTAQRDYFDQLINTPGTEDFLEAVKLEAAHQIERWGTEHDAGKRAEDWVALLAYLLGKATRAHYDGDQEKLKHHIITGAAAALNWHRALTGVSTLMRPGVEPREEEQG